MRIEAKFALLGFVMVFVGLWGAVSPWYASMGCGFILMLFAVLRVKV